MSQMRSVPVPEGGRISQERGLYVVTMPAIDVPLPYIDQLIDKSRQPHVMEHEGHEDVFDHETGTKGRYYDRDSYFEWASGKERTMYLLIKRAGLEDGETSNVLSDGAWEVRQGDDVGGPDWFGEKSNPLAPGYNTTFGTRLYAADEAKGYGQYHRRGLFKPFAEVAHDDFILHHPGSAVWLDLHDTNLDAYNAYTGFGYKELARPDGRIVMGYDGPEAVVAGQQVVA